MGWVYEQAGNGWEWSFHGVARGVFDSVCFYLILALDFLSLGYFYEMFALSTPLLYPGLEIMTMIPMESQGVNATYLP